MATPPARIPFQFAVETSTWMASLILAVANYNSNTMSVFINNGAGTFAAKVDYTTGTNPISVAVGDFKP